MRAEVEKAAKLLRAGEPDAIDHALALLQDTVFSFSMKVCGHREDAEDTMQDVLMKSLPYLSRFPDGRALVVWLYKVARNRCLTSRRRSKFAPKQSLSLEALAPDAKELARLAGGGSTPETSLLRGEVFERLRHAIDRLPPDYRFILVLHDMEGLDTAEVSRITGLLPGTVRVRLHRARLLIKKELAQSQPLTQPTPHVTTVKPRSCRKLFASLSEYLDRQLGSAICQKLETHLEGCTPCKAFLSDLEKTVEECHKFGSDCHSERAESLRKLLLKQFHRLTSALDKADAASSPSR